MMMVCHLIRFIASTCSITYLWLDSSLLTALSLLYTSIYHFFPLMHLQLNLTPIPAYLLSDLWFLPAPIVIYNQIYHFYLLPHLLNLSLDLKFIPASSLTYNLIYHFYYPSQIHDYYGCSHSVAHSSETFCHQNESCHDHAKVWANPNWTLLL